ncbi:TatD family hydrolase [candidate division WOR-3 bacterium]|nr:TatD family hydrolase [candidate division WOR-3 bacterium]
MTLTDTHAHLQDPRLEGDIENILKRAHQAGVGKIVVVSYDEASSSKASELTKDKENLFFTVGCHPHCAHDFVSEKKNMKKNFLHGFAGCEKLVAVGETGIDLYYGFSEMSDQIKVFEYHLEFALAAELPVVVHSRNAMDKVMEVLGSFEKIKVLLHSFEGNFDQAKKCLDRGYFLSFNGILTFKNADRMDVLRRTGMENAVFETDCPYLSPVPFRGRVNEPSYLKKILEFVSVALNREEESVADEVESNVNRLFSLN